MAMDISLDQFDYLLNRTGKTVHPNRWPGDLRFEKIEMLSGAPQKNTLYICTAHEPSADDPQMIINVSDTVSDNPSYTYLQNGRDTISALIDIFNAFFVYNNWKSTMFQLLSRKDFQTMGKLTSELLGADIVLIDKEYHIVHHTVGNRSTLYYEEYFQEQFDEMSVWGIQQLYLHNTEFDKTFMQKGLTHYPQDVIPGKRAYYCNLFLNDMYVGRILILVSDDQFFHAKEAFLKEYCEYVNSCYTTYMEAAYHYYPQSERHVAFKQFVNGMQTPTMTADVLGVEMPGRQFQVLCMQSIGDVTGEASLDYFCLQLEVSDARINAISNDHKIYCLINYEDSTYEILYNLLVSFARDHLFHVGISSAFFALGYISAGIREAEIALTLGEKINSGIWIHHFTKYIKPYLLYQITRDLPKDSVQHPALKALKEFDRKNADLHLYLTLRQYIHCHFNATLAAEQLHIHRSTFLYRMNKLRSIVSIDLDDWDAIMMLMISYRLDDEFGEKNETGHA